MQKIMDIINDAKTTLLEYKINHRQGGVVDFEFKIIYENRDYDIKCTLKGDGISALRSCLEGKVLSQKKIKPSYHVDGIEAVKRYRKGDVLKYEDMYYRFNITLNRHERRQEPDDWQMFIFMPDFIRINQWEAIDNG